MGMEPSGAFIAAAWERGLREVAHGDPMGEGDFPPGPFETLLILGGQLGRAGDLHGIRKLLRSLGEVAAPKAKLIVSYSIAKQHWPAILRFTRGGLASPWFHWAQIPSDDQVALIMDKAGWEPIRFVSGPGSEWAIVAELASMCPL